jgi:cytochrome c oxidase subunit 2
MKSVIRYTATIVITAVIAIGFACFVFGPPSASAQPAGSGAPPVAAEPAPPVAQPDKGAAGVGSAENPGVTPGSAAAGSAAPAEGAAPAQGSAGSAAGSAAPAAAGTGSAAPAAAGAGSAAPAAGELPWYEKLVNRPVGDFDGGNFWMPKSVNTVTDASDLMFIAVLALSAFFFFAIAIAVVYLVWKYRHRPGHKAQPSPAHHDALEITWTVIPTIITVFLFYYGWRSYIHIVTPPTKAVEINVLAQRWRWEFTHSNGVKDSDLHVPVNTPVRLVMTSTDVLHSFYVPVLRTKQDIIPRRYTYVWFNATKPGTYRLDCAEYCGTNHSQMGIQNDGRRAVVVVHEPGGYERYLADKAALSTNMEPDKLGRMLYEKKGCNGCHTIDGSARVGPTFLHDFGSTVPLSDGSKIQMDENYIRESLMYPQAKARPGYPPSMPSFEGQLKEKEIQGIIAFIKSLK